MQTGSCYPPTGVERYGNRPDGKLSAPPAGRRSVRAVNDLQYGNNRAASHRRLLENFHNPLIGMEPMAGFEPAA